jgi:hypothetical protein
MYKINIFGCSRCIYRPQIKINALLLLLQFWITTMMLQLRSKDYMWCVVQSLV